MNAPELLWPGGAPGWEDVEDNETTENRDVEHNAQGLNRATSRVSRPAIIPYLPPQERATGAAVIILPGGGFVHLAIDKEGHDVACWLNTLGVAGIVLKYRTDAEDREQMIAAAMADVQRALRTVRNRVEGWGIDPQRIGLIGFSAGGYLAARAAVDWDEGQPGTADPIARFSCRPDFVGLIYPGTPEGIAEQVTARTPPAFLAHADDDWLPTENSLRFYRGLRRAKVSGEMHIYAHGSHGFGLGVHGGAVASWTERFADWLEEVVASLGADGARLGGKG